MYQTHKSNLVVYNKILEDDLEFMNFLDILSGLSDSRLLGTNIDCLNQLLLGISNNMLVYRNFVML